MQIAKNCFMLLLASSMLVANTAEAKVVYARSKISNIEHPAGINNPGCTPVNFSTTIAERLKNSAIDAVGKAVAALPIIGGDDPFNTVRTNQSMCKDLCVVIPKGASFTARGSITGTDASAGWEGDLSAGLPKEIEVAGWAAINGPAVDSTDAGDVVCYTYKNWSHTTPRSIGLEVTY